MQRDRSRVAWLMAVQDRSAVIPETFTEFALCLPNVLTVALITLITFWGAPQIYPPGGGVLLKKLGRGVRPASQNPYPIYDQNLRFFPTLFMT